MITNRILRTEDRSPFDVEMHPENWRTHPEAQQAALSSVLEEIGWVQGVVVSAQTGRVLDGHLRVQVARERDTASVSALERDVDAEPGAAQRDGARE